MLQPDFYLPSPETEVYFVNKQAALIMEHDGALGLVDRLYQHIYHLKYASYQIGFSLLQAGHPYDIGLYQIKGCLPVGFWLGHGAQFIGQFQDGCIPPSAWMPTTRIVAGPNTLQWKNAKGKWRHTNWKSNPEDNQ